MDRPPVSVVVPFHGGKEDARAVLTQLARLELRPGDELIVADNTPEQVVSLVVEEPFRVVPAPTVRSSYFARNAGAEAAANEWMLFLDADCVPEPSLLDDYFAEPVGDRVGAVAGEVVGIGRQTALTARYARSRGHIGQAQLARHPHRPMAVTANLLVRRSAWQDLGGFQEGIRSSGDADFSWRLQDAGWELVYRPRATVGHRHRETLRALVRQAARYGAGRTWLERRHPGAQFARPGREIARAIAGTVVWIAALRFERALFKALDGVWVAAESTGSLMSNVARADVAPAVRAEVVGLLAQLFPDPSEAGLASRARSLEERGATALVEAAARPVRPDRGVGRGLAIAYREDDGTARRAVDFTWLAARHPWRALRDLSSRPRGHREALRSLAPSVRRLAARRVSRVEALAGSLAAPAAARVARLLGVPFARVPSGTGTEPDPDLAAAR